MEISENKAMTAKRQKISTKDSLKASVFKPWLLSLLLLIPLGATQAVELEYYYGGKTYNSLGEAEAAMRAAHADDGFDPREDVLAAYKHRFIGRNQVEISYKIDLPGQATASLDRKYWYMTANPQFKEYEGIKASESELISDFLGYRRAYEAGIHCEFPDFLRFENNDLTTPVRRWRNLANLGISYPPSINSGRLFYDKVPTIGWYILHGWSSPQSGLCCTNCGLEGGDEIDETRSHGNTSEIELYICPEGYILGEAYRSYGAPKTCTLVQINDVIRKQVKYALTMPKQCPTTKDGNPCDAATGSKYQSETDFALANGSLKVQRHYSTQGVGDGFSDLGPRWRHNYAARRNGYQAPDYDNYPMQKSAFYDQANDACGYGWNELKGEVYGGLLANSTASYSSGACKIRYQGKVVMTLPLSNTHDASPKLGSPSLLTFYRANGNALTFQLSGGNWQPLSPTSAQLSETEAGWRLTTSNGALEDYDSGGKLVSSRDSNGQTTEYAYDDEGRLATVTGHFGDTLNYHYNANGRLSGITTPQGELEYGYDAQGRLVRVTYPDSSQKVYHYEESRFPSHLTGITDENGERFATWAYDEQGRAIVSEHAGGAERIELAYNANGTTTITDAAGAERTYHFTATKRGIRLGRIEGDRCDTCPNSDTQAYTYDSNGFIASQTDWNGNTTSYTRDEQGRELSRTEADGTPQARTITTSWDSELNKPLVVTGPQRITEYRYDANGHLLSRQQRERP
jgi:YD repeat-containing protein